MWWERVSAYLGLKGEPATPPFGPLRMSTRLLHQLHQQIEDELNRRFDAGETPDDDDPVEHILDGIVPHWYDQVPYHPPSVKLPGTMVWSEAAHLLKAQAPELKNLPLRDGLDFEVMRRGYVILQGQVPGCPQNFRKILRPGAIAIHQQR